MKIDGLKVLKITGFALTGIASILMTYVSNKEAQIAIPKAVTDCVTSMRFKKKD